jgi:hypothetical protein
MSLETCMSACKIRVGGRFEASPCWIYSPKNSLVWNGEKNIGIVEEKKNHSHLI